MSPVHIGLPEEILEEVFRRLDFLSLLKCRSVGQRWKAMIDDSSEFQYIIELRLDGMTDFKLVDLAYAERLAKLRDRREAWSNLNWKTRSIIPMPGLCHAYELVGGLFVRGSGDDFTVSWLPSATSGGRQLHTADLRIHARDFAIDPGQDLVVFLVDGGGPSSNHESRPIRLHIRTLTTHEVHPNAHVPVLTFSIAPDVHLGTFIRSIMLELADDVVAVFLSTVTERLLIWNWREGYLISDSANAGHELPSSSWDFSFISSRAYIITSNELCGSIRIMGFESKEGSHPIHIVTLHFPELKDLVIVRDLSTHTGPLNTPSSNMPFVTSPTSRIHVLTIEYMTHHFGPQPRYCAFVHNRTFLSYVADYAIGRSAAGIQLPWESWGPHNTRFLSSHSPFTWLRYVHGQRVICPQRLEDLTGMVQVLDFNAHRLQKTTPGVIQKTYTGPSYIAQENIFKYDVRTTLPYCVTMRANFGRYSALMIDEERIVGLKTEGPADEELTELHVYTF